MLSFSRRTFALAFVALLALVCPLWAQSDRGTITGTVTDQSGAVMAGVSVSSTNTATGVVTKTTSGPGGTYTIPLVRVGTYEVDAEFQGFKKFVQSGLVVEVGQTVALDIHMQIGSVTETVQVTAQPLLAKDNSTKDTVVTSRDVEELPIVSQSEIRNPGFYINLAPGVVSRGTVTSTASGSGRQLDSTVNGSPSGAVEFFLDGMQIGQGGMMTGQFGDLPFPPDSVGEFRVMTLLPEAEMGQTALGVVSFAMKSGTNQIHGEGYEYVRNNALDACGFFACEAAGSTTPVNKQNEFGGNVGGPVVLPHIYDGRDKTFFFGWYHGFRLRNEPSNALDTVPTVAMQHGNFSNLGQTAIADCGPKSNQACMDAIGRPMYSNEAYDPATTRTVAAGAADPETGLINTSGASAILRDGFGYSPTTGLPISGSANIIPSNRIDPLSAKLFTYFPQSGMLAGNEFGYVDNWLASYRSLTNTTEWGAKMDHNISSRNRIMGEFAWSNEYNPTGSKWPGAITNGGTGYTQQDIARFSHDFIFSPTVVNHVAVGFNRLGTMSYPGAGTGWPAKLGYSGVPQTGPGSVFPELSIGDLGNLYATQGQGYGATNVFNVNENLEWIKGKHSLKFGGSYTKFQVNSWSASYQSSFLTFDEGTTSLPGPAAWYNDSCPPGGACTGMGAAGFLLGDVSTATAGITGVTAADRYAYYGFFAQDDYKFSRKLTLNIGLRYDIFRPDVDAHNALSWVSPFATNTQYNIKGAMVFATSGQRSPVSASLGDLGPRFGLAYALNDKTVIRSGYGMLYTAGGIERALSGTSGAGRLGYNASNALPENVVSGYPGLTPVFQVSSGWPSSKFPLPPFINQSYEVGQGPFFEGFPGDNKVPSIQNWTFDVQRQIPGSILVDVAYVGTKGTHLPSRLQNSNVMPTKYADSFLYEASASPYTPGNYLFSTIGTPAVQALPIVQAMPIDPVTGNHSPFHGFEQVWGSSATLGQALRPFPQYTSDTTEGLSQMRDFGEGVGNSSYNALQVQVKKQFSEGLTFIASYTWEKTMTDAGSLFNEFSGFTQDFYNSKAERSLALNDYPQTLTLSYEYHLPFGPGKKFANQGGAMGRVVGGWEIAGFHSYQSGPPSIIASGSNPLTPYSGPNSFLTRPNVEPGVPKRSAAYLEGKWNPNGGVVNGVDYGAVNNVAAWSNPSSNTLNPWTLGDAPATDGSVRGFGWLDEDISLIKKTQIKERLNVEFRADFLNIFNRTVFGFDQGGDQYGSILQGNQVSAGLGGFGHITTQENFPREIQFGLKIKF
jgi:hypothetical protein